MKHRFVSARANWTLAAVLMTVPGWVARPLAAGPPPAQTTPAPDAASRQVHSPAPPAPLATDQNAERTREQLMDFLERFPDAVSRVLKLDPSLLTNQAYLTAYPGLSAFLTQHPEIARNPAYFFEKVPGVNSYSYPRPTNRLMEETLAGAAVITGFTIGLLSLGWFVRTIVDYRRWNRLSRVQAEAHNKLLDRFSANAELISYIQSPAGAQFLQSAPISLDPGARRLGAPISRIFWSLQAGLVLVMGGLGLEYISGRVTDIDAQQACYAIGVLGMALGAGFVISAAVAYFLSRRLGLFETPSNDTQNFKLKTQN